MASSSNVLSHGAEMTGGKKRTVCELDVLKESVNKQSRQDQAGQSFDPDSDIENKENDLHLNTGTFNNVSLEEVSETDGDDYEQAEASTLEESRCDKNKIHNDYIPFGVRSFPGLPETYDSEDVACVVEALGKLIVKIVVAKTSAKRPEVFRGTTMKYPRGKVTGTGKINFSKPGNGGGEIRIVTCAHVVHHQSEAKHTKCILNYDSKDSPTMELKCRSVHKVNVENDRCELLCVTSDVELAQKLKKDIYDFLNIHQELHGKYKNGPENNLVLTVSHPHGCPKCVSVGKYTDKKSFKSHLPHRLNTKYTYLLTTCTGSSGAPIYRLDKEKVRTLHPHSIGGKVGAEFGGESGVEWEEITI